MILTPELKEEVVRLMNDYWATYFGGDLDKFATFLAPDFKNIGTTLQEIWSSKEEMMAFTSSIMPQTVGVAELRNRHVEVMDMDPHIMAHEFGDVYVKSGEEWEFYARFRLSTVLKKYNGEWKVWHQHGSYPDARTVEDEAFGLDQVRAENVRLHQAVEQRTRTLELQSRELEIEAALERVRSRSMGMQRSEELSDVIEVIFAQLAQLNINTEHAGIVVDFSPGEDWNFWIADVHGTPSRITAPFIGYKWDRQFTEAKEKGHRFFTTKLDFEEKNDFYGKLLDHIPDLTKKVREFYMECPGLAISTSVQDDVGLYVENFEGVPFSEDENSIIRRFGDVLQQTYTRFLDLQKAEEQTREAQIEVALERVRNRATAMRSSSELSDLVITVFHELSGLDMVLTRCLLWIFEPEDNSAVTWMTNSEDPDKADSYSVPYHDHPAYKSYLDAWRSRQERWEYVLKGEVKESWDEQLVYGYFGSLPEAIKLAMKEPEQVILSGSFNKYGVIQTASLEPLSSENQDILVRFSQVFEQSYTRFKDLVTAEELAREAQIELSLERIRARVTAMKESNDLLDIVVTMRDEFAKLGHEAHYFWHMRWLPEKYQKAMTSGDGTRIGMVMELPRHIHGDIPLLADWERGDSPSVVYAMNTDEALDYVGKMVSLGDFEQIDPHAPTEDDLRAIKGLTFVMARTTHGEIGFSLPGRVPEPNPESIDSLVRFAGVFDLAYRRFEDLKEAELKNRENEIELALERVRSKAMAMRSSEELHDVLSVLFEQFDILRISPVHCTLTIFDEEANTAEFMMTGKGGKRVIAKQMIRLDAMDEWKDLVKQWKNSTPNSIHSPHYPPELLPKVWDIFDEIISQLPDDVRIQQEDFPDGMYFCEGNYDFGYVGFCHTREHTDEEEQIVLRFATELSRLYRRFLDLQKAEEQAREAQIEAALERVRAASMAMHRTDELGKVVETLFRQFGKLKLDFYQVWINIFKLEEGYSNCWFSPVAGIIDDPYTAEVPLGPFEETSIKSWRAGEDFSYLSWNGREKVDEIMSWLTEITEHASFNEIQKVRQMERLEIVDSNHKYGVMALAKNDDITDDDLSILRRFTNVFEQAYTRFLDLQVAERQARESQIEASLEKVRSSTIGMQKSSELREVSNLLFQQVRQLGVNAWSAGYCIWDDDKNGITLYMSSEDVMQPPLWAPLDEDDSFRNFKAADDRGESFWVGDIGGDEIIEHYKYMYTLTGVGDVLDSIQNEGHKLPSFQVYHCVYFEHGFLLFITYEHVPESHGLFQRFGKVFDQTYTRFLDLKLAETQAYQAQIETALERVRARALAMQTPEELQDVADVMRREMGALGVEELETSSIYINDTETGRVECWYALKDIRESSSEMISDHFELDLSATWVGREMLDFYNSDEMKSSIVMTGQNRIEWINYCEQHSPNLTGYYGEEIPDRTYHLYKFSHGAIGAASAGSISDESWDLLQRAASVFSLAYSRFKDLTQARLDLQRLKEEKKRAEAALKELKETQDQLVHAEKMASLGELTAGIAHEIKNPLNFVNNFSEVSNELLEELQEELEAGNYDEVSEIVTFVTQNLEKIATHGKRADGIVKSMLQHSRSSAGEKEPVDINGLVDEYLRLAYHGLRAKDKTFNATFDMNLASEIGEVRVIRQEIGRVLLNLMNNAFYAVNEKSQNEVDFKPTVTVTTSDGGENVVITVKDNGMGIPEDLVTKIFQPFFTTKPTGEGTGLGLSLSYDIVKSHGGDMRVVSSEGVGTEMIITLPKN